MGHLLNDLGASYVSDFFTGAFFMHEGELYQFRGMNYKGKLDTYKLVGKPLQASYAAKNAELDPNIIESFTKFSWPKLGYRNQRLSNGLVVAAYFQSVRSTRRGLMDEGLSITYDAATQVAMSATYEHAGRTAAMYQVFFPKWFTYREALSLLTNGDALAVALNEDVCITHNVDPSDTNAALDVLFRGRPVGNILHDGSVIFKNKSISKMNMFKKLLNNRN